MTLLEVLGQKVMDLAELNSHYDAVLDLLGRVACGEIKPEWVAVDRTTRSWSFAIPPLPKPVEDQ